MGRLEAKGEVETPEAAVPKEKSGVSFPPTKEETEPVASFPPQDEAEPVVSFPPAQGEPVVSFPPQVEPEPVFSFPPNVAEEQPVQFIGCPWTTGLFDCNENPNAAMTFILPCVTFGQIAEILDAGQLTCPVGSSVYALTMPVLCFWVMGSKYRTKLRTRYGLVEAPYQDKISHMFCPCCSLSQEFRELKKRDLDPALGWNGILAQQQAMQYGHQQINTPPPAQTMSM